jgi:hypothetical protein
MSNMTRPRQASTATLRATGEEDRETACKLHLLAATVLHQDFRFAILASIDRNSHFGLSSTVEYTSIRHFTIPQVVILSAGGAFASTWRHVRPAPKR